MTEKKLQCSLWLPGFRRLLAVKMHFPLSPNKGDGLPVLYTASLPDGLLSELSPSCAPLGETRHLGWILGKCGLHVVNLSWYNSPSSHVRSAPKFTISRRERSGILSAFQLPFSSSTPHSSVNSNFIQGVGHLAGTLTTPYTSSQGLKGSQAVSANGNFIAHKEHTVFVPPT